MTILDLPILSRIRRNHGLEHATISLLSQRFPYRRMAGYSFPGGFFLLGDVPTEQVREVVAQALSRMNNGERYLAVHPNCGTNFAVSGLLAGLLAWLGMAGAKSKRDQVHAPAAGDHPGNAGDHPERAARPESPGAYHHLRRPAGAVHCGYFPDPLRAVFPAPRDHTRDKR